MEELVFDINEAARPGAATASVERDAGGGGSALWVGAAELDLVPEDVVAAVEGTGVGRERLTEGELKEAFSQRVVVLRTGGVGIELRTLFALFVAIVLNAICLAGIYYSTVYEWRWLGGGAGGSGSGSGGATGTTGTTGNGGVLMVGEGAIGGDMALTGTGGAAIRPFIPTPEHGAAFPAVASADLPVDKSAETDLAQAEAKLLGDDKVIAFAGGASPQVWTAPRVVRPAPVGPVIEAPTPKVVPVGPTGPAIAGPKEHVNGTPGLAVASLGTGGGHGKGQANLGGEDAGTGDEGEPVFELLKPGTGGGNGRGGNGLNRGPSGANSDQPVPLELPAPGIPLDLQATAYKTRVTFELQILSNGHVGKIKMLRGSGSAELDGVYRSTVAKFKFHPPMRAGHPAEGVFIYSFVGPGAPDRDAASGGGGGGDGG